jgi:hypothetical protein
LTFTEEEFKLGYMVASNPKLELFGNKVVNRKISEVKSSYKRVANLPRKNLTL